MDRQVSRSQVYEDGVDYDDQSASESDMRDSDIRDSDYYSNSRAPTPDSEEAAAVLNGKKTLEEVAARLNDLDGDPKTKRIQRSKRGVTPTERPSFLSNLFNYRAYNSGIVVDEEDANQEDNPIADIFVWRFPLVTACWFSILQVLFFLVHFCDYTLLAIASFLGLWQLVVDLILVKVVPVLQKKGFVNEDLDIKYVVRKTILFNPQLIKQVGSAAYELADLMIGMWRLTVLEANLSRILIVGRFVFVVFFRSFSVATTTWILFMILFTIPVSYSNNRVLADAVADGAHVAASRNFEIVRRFSNGLVDAAARRFQDSLEEAGKAPEATKQSLMLRASLWGIALTSAQNIDLFLTKLIG